MTGLPPRVKLEYLDESKTRIHTRDLEYDGLPPIPAPGETVMITDPGGPYELARWRIVRREFFYLLPNTPGFPDVKVSFWCERVL